MRLTMLAIAASASLLAACGAESPAGPAGTGGSSSACPTGHVIGPHGDCMAVGIQGCAELFIEEDGLCHPAMDKCPAGTIPQFVGGTPRTPGLDEGCVPVGIPSCAEVFLEDDGLCHPSMDKCPEGTFAVPTEGCVPIDGPDGCGSGTWGNIPDGPDTVWVDPSHMGGDGDGSQQKPLTTIAAAMEAVPPGGRVALAAGGYDEPVVIEKPLELVGRCPSMVTIGGTTTWFGVPVIVLVRGTEGVKLGGVHIGGPGIGVIADGAGVVVRRCVVKASTDTGVLAYGQAADVTVERSLVADTLPQPSDGKGGRGIEVQQGANTKVVTSAVAQNHEVGVAAFDAGTTVTVEGSLVAGTLPRPSYGDLGHGIAVRKGAGAKVVASAVVDNHEAGVGALGVGTTVTVERSLVADTQPRPDGGELGHGIEVEQGAVATVVASAVVANHATGVGILGAGTTVTVERSLVADTQPRPDDGELGHGIEVQQGASATVVASAVVDNREAGVLAFDAGTTLTLERSLVSGTLPRPGDGELGHGIEVQQGASATVVASAVAENHEVGVAAFDAGTNVLLDQSLVSGTLLRPSDGEAGRGIGMQRGASGTVVASAVVDNHETGVLALGAGSTVAVQRSLVARTLPRADGSSGVGLLCTGAVLSLDGSVVRASHGAGVMAAPAGMLTVIGSHIDGVLPGSFHTYVDNEIIATYDGISDGIILAFDSAATLTDTRVTGCQRAGFVFDTSSGLLARVSTEGARYGLVAQGEPKPDWSDPGNVFQGTELSILTDGDLPVPGPPPIPEE